MNYLKLTQLIPDLHEAEDNLLYAFRDPQGVINIHLRERGPYTATLDVTHQTPGLQRLIPDIQIAVKVYYDAELAEVVCYQNQDGFQPKNSYPNSRMHHKYEKADLNRFLTEWLDYCLKQKASISLA
ncbi:MAG: DUF1249 domain-containing protein [Gammaproteobacteria bacterium]|nr:DUF1249 domain-containing protein [Gammaproteobacteria bacterium]